MGFMFGKLFFEGKTVTRKRVTVFLQKMIFRTVFIILWLSFDVT